MGDPDLGTKAGTERAGRSAIRAIGAFWLLENSRASPLSRQASFELQKCSTATHTNLENLDASPDYLGIDRFIRDVKR